MSDQRRVDDISRVFLKRDVLLRISSAQLNARVAWIRQHHPLSQAEAHEVTRQRRLVTNREAARRARRLHKEYVETLQQENARLRQQLAELRGAGATGSAEPPEPLQFGLELFDDTSSTLSF